MSNIISLGNSTATNSLIAPLPLHCSQKKKVGGKVIKPLCFHDNLSSLPSGLQGGRGQWGAASWVFWENRVIQPGARGQGSYGNKYKHLNKVSVLFSGTGERATYTIYEGSCGTPFNVLQLHLLPLLSSSSTNATNNFFHRCNKG